MSALLEFVRDKPIGFWTLDTASPHTDKSGYGNAATSSGSNTHPALGAGLQYATVFSDANRGQFTFPTFVRTMEWRQFTIEAVIRPITYPAEQQIVGHLGAYDGLTINGSTLSFVTKYTNAGEARASYLLNPMRSVHVVGVHTPQKNSLYIDGVLVDEIDLTEEQRVAQYSVDSSIVYAGQSSGTGTFAMNALALYNYSLSPEAISRHAFAAKDVPDANSVIESFGGDRVGFSSSASTSIGEAYIEEVYEYAEDWDEGLHTNTTVDGDDLILNGDVSDPVQANWLTTFDLGLDGATSIYGVQVSWEGEGIVLETSLDGTGWSTVTNGRFVSGITSGFNPTDKDLFVRVTFNGSTDAYVSNLTITAYANAAATTSSRTLTRTGTIYERSDGPVMDFADGWGIELAGGALTISPPDDDTGATGPGTIELWARNLTSAAGTLVDARSSTNTGYAYLASSGTTYSGNGTLYVNGTAVGQPYTWRVGQWTLIHLVLTNTSPTTIHIGENYLGAARGKYEIGSIALYDAQLTASDISDVYKTYVGRPAFRQSDNSVIRVTQSTTGALIYAADWSIQSVG